MATQMGGTEDGRRQKTHKIDMIDMINMVRYFTNKSYLYKQKRRELK